MTSDSRSRPLRQATLLVGPTGSGKTPLGEQIAARGLWGRACAHFDFGENLREIVDRGQADEHVSQEEIELLRGVLQTGALLEDDRFPLALRVFLAFLARRAPDPGTRIVLNGLPRHVGQAEAMEARVHVDSVVRLACDEETVVQRIRNNVAGDRTGRADDDREAIRRKLALFRSRTAPLLDFYRTRNARILGVDVAADTTPEQAWTELNALQGPGGP